MSDRQALVAAGLAGVAAVAGALWVLTAYAYGPPVAMTALGAVAAVVVVVARPAAGIALVLAVEPFRRASIPIGDAQAQPLRFLLPVVAVMLLAYALLTARDERTLRAGAFVAVVVATLAAVAVSALQALDPARSLGEVARLATAVMLMLAALLVVRSRGDVVIIVCGVLAGLLGAGIQGLVQQAQGTFSELSFAGGGQDVHRIQGLFGHPNQYAGYLAFLLPTAASLAIGRGVPRALRRLGALAVAAGLPALALTYTRGALVGLIIGSVVWLAAVRPRAAAATAVLFAVAFAAASPTLVGERVQNVNTGEVAVRTDQWGAALDIYAGRPLLGVGIDNFGRAYASLPSELPSASQRRLLHDDELIVPPHANNLYLTTLAEGGVIGLAAMLLAGALALAAAVRGARSADPLVRALALGAGAGLLVLGAHDVLEITLLDVSEPLLVLVAVVDGLAVRAGAPAGPGAERAPAGPPEPAEAAEAPRPPEAHRHPGGTPAPDPAASAPAETPRIAVVIPTYNDAEYLAAAVASIREAEPVETIVVDDGSDMREAKRVLAGLERDGTRVVRKPNGGPASARNTGLRASAAPFVLFLDSDDVLAPGALAALADLLGTRPDAGFAWGDYVEFGAVEGRCRMPDRMLPWSMTYLNLLNPCLMFRRETLEAVDGWPEREYEDWALVLSLLEHDIEGVSLGRVVYHRRLHHDRRELATSRRRHAAVYAELRRCHAAAFARRAEWRRLESPPVWKRLAYPVLWGSRRVVPVDLEERVRLSAAWRRLRVLRTR